MIKPILVNNIRLIREFHLFSYNLYANDINYIRPMEHDVEAVFSRKKNKLFHQGECERYLFKDEKGYILGKVAVFINKKYKNDQPTGGIGFIDFIEDYTVAAFIFDFCKEWHLSRGMQAIDGPINFGERDRFWGLLVEGFTEPLYGMNYHKPYYRDYFERYGFQIYFEQLCFTRNINLDVGQNMIENHERITTQYPNIKAIPINKKNLEKFALDFATIYNKAWASHGGGKTIDDRQAKKIFQSMKAVIDEEICWFIYDGDVPIAMWINLPDLNQWFKYLQGKFTILHKLIFLVLKKFMFNPRMVGLVFGVVPEWQRKGIDNFMIIESTKRFINTTKYTQYEMQWIGSFNPKMINIAKSLNTEVSRKLITYRLIVDENIKFSPHPIL